MNQHYHISLDDLLVKYLLQEASPEQRQTVDQWLAADPANQQHFDQLKLIWEKSLRLAPRGSLPEIEGEEEQAWQALKEKLHQPAHRETPNQPARETPNQPAHRETPHHRARIRTIRWVATAAAAVAALIWWRPTPVSLQKISSNNAIRIDTLTDGSIVTLNKHSTLSQPSTFAAGQRAVSLEGEAFFQVAPDRDRPFRVQTNDIAITVLGTAFDVRTQNKKTTIVVETGLIEVKNRQGIIRVSAGETITLGQNDVRLQKQSAVPSIYRYYRPRDFVCRETPLGDLVDALNQAYGDSIHIADPAIRQLPITTTFHDETLHTILEVVGTTLSINVQQTEKGYLLEKK
ncbi:MAG TPA: FecR domain-containing protein [Puia sp.]|nr:FecR domain-containing protein [Puia sp.]